MSKIQENEAVIQKALDTPLGRKLLRKFMSEMPLQMRLKPGPKPKKEKE